MFAGLRNGAITIFKANARNIALQVNAAKHLELAGIFLFP
jgi:hypothetical protein